MTNPERLRNMITLTVSDNEIQQIKNVAAKNDMTMVEIVRKALTSQYGIRFRPREERRIHTRN